MARGTAEDVAGAIRELDAVIAWCDGQVPHPPPGTSLKAPADETA